jgi:hypothetical protein
MTIDTVFPRRFASALATLAAVLFAPVSPGADAPSDGARTLKVEAVNRLPAKAKRYAVVVGVDKYADPQITTLEGATNDARTLAWALVEHAAFPADQVILMTSDQSADRVPTRGNILGRLYKLAGVVPKDGLLVVAFAGHGIERGGKAFLLPSDTQLSDDIDLLQQTAIGVADIKDKIRRTGVDQVLLVLDACRNDPVAGRGSADNLMSDAFARGLSFDVRNREVRAFATLYATEVGKRAYEYKEKRQGYFTWALVEGLRGGAANNQGEVTLSGLVKYLQEQLPRKVALDLGKDRTQRPFAVVEGYRADELVIAAPGRKLATTAPGPDTSFPVEPAKPVNHPDDRDFTLADTAWNGSSPVSGEFTYQFLPDGKMRYVTEVLRDGSKVHNVTAGTWRQAGRFVQLMIGGYSTLEGNIEGRLMRLTGTNVQGEKFTSTVFFQRP